MILVPRPQQHLARTREALESAQISDFYTLALSTPEPLPIAIPHGITALIFTSPFAVHPALPRLPAACVGEITASIAESQGFEVFLIGTSNAQSLAESIVSNSRQHQFFLHPHGDHATTDWHHTLRKAGHSVVPVLSYRTQPTTSLPTTTIHTLMKKSPTHTLLFSAESARHLAKLFKQSNIPAKGTAICLSEAVAQAAKPHWPRILVSPASSLKGMITCLKKDIAA